MSTWTMQRNDSLASSLASLPEAQRREILSELTEKEAENLLYDWRFWARPNQLPPGETWATWLVMAGRGFGKTRTGAEFVRDGIETGQCRRVALAAPTAADARDVMVEGESGILAICPPWNRPVYEPSKRRVTWPNGAIATTYSADEPDRLRGPQHDRAWADEIGTWRYPEAWDMLMFGLRLGIDPRCAATTTPKPVKLVKDLLKEETTVVTRGTTYENMGNLAPSFIRSIVKRYEGTRLGRQELKGELLEDIEGALWQLAWIDQHRVKEAPQLQRVVVAIDPAGTHKPQSDSTGIAVVGKGDNGEWYVLHAYGYKMSPNGWASRAVDLYDQYQADRILGEVNNGGEMVESTIGNVRQNLPFTMIHATRGKALRAEPIASLYEQGRVHHTALLPELEEQMCLFPVAHEHDDMVDALVYALTELSEDRAVPSWWLKEAKSA